MPDVHSCMSNFNAAAELPIQSDYQTAPGKKRRSTASKINRLSKYGFPPEGRKKWKNVVFFLFLLFLNFKNDMKSDVH